MTRTWDISDVLIWRGYEGNTVCEDPSPSTRMFSDRSRPNHTIRSKPDDFCSSVNARVRPWITFRHPFSR